MASKILIATPQPEFGELIRLNIEEGGEYEATLVKTGREVMELANSTRFDLVILDASLPDKPFIPMAQNLIDENPQMKIIVLPPNNDPKDPSLDEILYHGVLSRPFYPPDLVEMVNELLIPPPLAPTPAAKPGAEPVPITEVPPVQENNPPTLSVVAEIPPAPEAIALPSTAPQAELPKLQSTDDQIGPIDEEDFAKEVEALFAQEANKSKTYDFMKEIGATAAPEAEIFSQPSQLQQDQAQTDLPLEIATSETTEAVEDENDAFARQLAAQIRKETESTHGNQDLEQEAESLIEPETSETAQSNAEFARQILSQVIQETTPSPETAVDLQVEQAAVNVSLEDTSLPPTNPPQTEISMLMPLPLQEDVQEVVDVVEDSTVSSDEVNDQTVKIMEKEEPPANIIEIAPEQINASDKTIAFDKKEETEVDPIDLDDEEANQTYAELTRDDETLAQKHSAMAARYTELASEYHSLAREHAELSQHHAEIAAEKARLLKEKTEMLSRKRELVSEIYQTRNVLKEMISKTNAIAAIILKNGDLVAHVGDLSHDAILEIASILVRYWDGDKKSDLIRFLRLQSDHSEQQLYAALIQEDFILGLIYEPATSISLMRAQATRITRNLSAEPLIQMLKLPVEDLEKLSSQQPPEEPVLDFDADEPNIFKNLTKPGHETATEFNEWVPEASEIIKPGEVIEEQVSDKTTPQSQLANLDGAENAAGLEDIFQSVLAKLQNQSASSDFPLKTGEKNDNEMPVVGEISVPDKAVLQDNIANPNIAENAAAPEDIFQGILAQLQNQSASISDLPMNTSENEIPVVEEQEAPDETLLLDNIESLDKAGNTVVPEDVLQNVLAQLQNQAVSGYNLPMNTGDTWMDTISEKGAPAEVDFSSSNENDSGRDIQDSSSAQSDEFKKMNGQDIDENPVDISAILKEVNNQMDRLSADNDGELETDAIPSENIIENDSNQQIPEWITGGLPTEDKTPYLPNPEQSQDQANNIYNTLPQNIYYDYEEDNWHIIRGIIPDQAEQLPFSVSEKNFSPDVNEANSPVPPADQSISLQEEPLEQNRANKDQMDQIFLDVLSQLQDQEISTEEADLLENFEEPVKNTVLPGIDQSETPLPDLFEMEVNPQENISAAIEITNAESKPAPAVDESSIEPQSQLIENAAENQVTSAANSPIEPEIATTIFQDILSQLLPEGIPDRPEIEPAASEEQRQHFETIPSNDVTQEPVSPQNQVTTLGEMPDLVFIQDSITSKVEALDQPSTQDQAVAEAEMQEPVSIQDQITSEVEAQDQPSTPNKVVAEEEAQEPDSIQAQVIPEEIPASRMKNLLLTSNVIYNPPSLDRSEFISQETSAVIDENKMPDQNMDQDAILEKIELPADDQDLANGSEWFEIKDLVSSVEPLPDQEILSPTRFEAVMDNTQRAISPVQPVVIEPQGSVIKTALVETNPENTPVNLINQAENHLTSQIDNPADEIPVAVEEIQPLPQPTPVSPVNPAALDNLIFPWEETPVLPGDTAPINIKRPEEETVSRTQPIHVKQPPTELSPTISTTQSSNETGYKRTINHLFSHQAYTCVLVPRLLETPISSELAYFLGEQMTQLASVFDWSLGNIQIQTNYMLWTIEIMPAVPIANIIRLIRQRTSKRIFAQFTDLSNFNDIGDFWAPGFLAASSTVPPTGAVIDDFINQTRRRQDLLKALET